MLGAPEESSLKKTATLCSTAAATAAELYEMFQGFDRWFWQFDTSDIEANESFAATNNVG